MSALIIAVLLLLVACVWYFSTYNRFIRAKNMLREAWSDIDVQLKRRHDLIPNLIETVKGYAAHEKSTLTDATALRGSGMQSDNARERGQAENELTQSIKSLFAVAEAYPDLKANQSFLSLQQTLTEVEDQIQYARRYYNGAARDMNVLVESFPSNIVANAFGFQRSDYFEIELATERTVPEANFA